MTLEAHQSTPTSHEDWIRRMKLTPHLIGNPLKNIALFPISPSAVISPKVPVGRATTTTADEMPKIRLQHEDDSPLLGYVRFYV